MEDQLDRILLRAPVRAAPGVRAALRRLADHGIRLGLVSTLVHETSAGAQRALARLDLDRWFSSRVFSCDHPWSKPRPEPFRHCLRELGVRPSAAVHVGDRTVDVRGARAAGLAPILYTGLHRIEYAPGRVPVQSGLGAVLCVPHWKHVPAAVGIPSC
jgi:HAD superfamily hydrolase (TIGR01509 family)